MSTCLVAVPAPLHLKESVEMVSLVPNGQFLLEDVSTERANPRSASCTAVYRTFRCCARLLSQITSKTKAVPVPRILNESVEVVNVAPQQCQDPEPLLTDLLSHE